MSRGAAYENVAEGLRQDTMSPVAGQRAYVIAVPVMVHVRGDGSVGMVAWPTKEDVQTIVDEEMRP